MVIAVAALMFFMELVDYVLSDGNVKFIALSAIAQIKAPFIVRNSCPSLAAELLSRRRFQLAKFALKFWLRDAIVKSAEQSSRVIPDHVTYQDAKG